MTRPSRALMFAAMVAALPAVALAQGRSNPRAEFSVGGAATGPTRFRGVGAEQFTPQGGVRRLFVAESQLDVAPAIWTRAGVRILPRLILEGGGMVSRGPLVTRISDDAETSAVDVSTTLTRYSVDAGLLADLARWRRGRVRPFATVGASYIRQVSDGRLLVQTGRAYYVGGGLHYLLRDNPARRVQSAGVRFDVRAQIAGGALSLDGADHIFPSAGASFFIRF